MPVIEAYRGDRIDELASLGESFYLDEREEISIRVGRKLASSVLGSKPAGFRLVRRVEIADT